LLVTTAARDLRHDFEILGLGDLHELVILISVSPRFRLSITLQTSRITMAPQGESSRQNGAKGKGKDKGKGGGKPLVKTNKAKRERIDAELRELQAKIDNYVSISYGVSSHDS
jgi:hypothetical protein